MPFASQCSEWLRDANGADSPLIVVTALCETQQLGRYKPGKRRGRCNDDDLQGFSNQMCGIVSIDTPLILSTLINKCRVSIDCLRTLVDQVARLLWT